MRKQKKVLSVLMALAIGITASTTPITEYCDDTMVTVSAEEKASMSNVLSLYKNKKYSQAKKCAKSFQKKLPKSA